MPIPKNELFYCFMGMAMSGGGGYEVWPEVLLRTLTQFIFFIVFFPSLFFYNVLINSLSKTLLNLLRYLLNNF